MTKQEIAQLLIIIKAVHSNFISDVAKINVWHALIGDIAFDDAKKALYYVLNTNKFEPKPADIREVLIKSQASNIPSAGEAWGEVLRKADIYKADIDWSHDLIRKAVQIIGLRTICTSEAIGVERAHFLKVYETLAVRKSQNAIMQGLGLIVSSSDDKLKLEVQGG